jgi:hypothetical protein
MEFNKKKLINHPGAKRFKFTYLSIYLSKNVETKVPKLGNGKIGIKENKGGEYCIFTNYWIAKFK